MLYFLNFNIDSKAAPVMQSAGTDREHPLKQGELDVELDSFILMIEGFHLHAPKIAQEDAKSMMEDVKKVIKQFYALRDSIQLSSPYGIALHAKVKYAIKVLNRLEVLLHINCTKGAEVEKTPEHIRHGISNYSQEAASKGLKKG